MLLKPVWLLAFAVGSAFATFCSEEVQGELAQAVEARGQQPFVYEEPPHYPNDKCNCTTIYKLLSNDSRFSLVTKALNYVEDVAALLNDSSARVTFFAPPDKALRRPHEEACEHGICASDAMSEGTPFAKLATVADVDIPSTIPEYGNLREAIYAMEKLEAKAGIREPDDDDDKKKRIIREVIRAILRYHILPGVYSSQKFGEYMTYATNLTVRGALDDQAIRLRVSQSVIPPATKINFFTRVTHPDIKALNGLVHVVDSPLIPPPSIFQQLYMLPHVFSTLTSAMQRTGLNNWTDLRFIPGGNLTGASALTLFAPTNDAFDALPKKLRLYLFSPFGERALKKLIEYHIVPNAVVHSNFIHGDVIEPMDMDEADVDLEEDEGCVDAWSKKHKHHKHKKHHKPPRHSELIESHNLTLVSLLPEHTIDTVITRERVSFPAEINRKHKHKHKHPKHPEYQLVNTKVIVNDQPAIVTDVVAFNGAMHAVNRLLDPRHCRCGGPPDAVTHDNLFAPPEDDSHEADLDRDEEDIWAGWEEWFPEWLAN